MRAHLIQLLLTVLLAGCTVHWGAAQSSSSSTTSDMLAHAADGVDPVKLTRSYLASPEALAASEVARGVKRHQALLSQLANKAGRLGMDFSGASAEEAGLQVFTKDNASSAEDDGPSDGGATGITDNSVAKAAAARDRATAERRENAARSFAGKRSNRSARK